MPRSDFDFQPGAWRVANRRLVDTLDPECDEWEEFEATSEARSILGAPGTSTTSAPRATRAGDPRPRGRGGSTRPSRAASARTVRRFDWSEITATSARGDQSFSFDGSATQEPNWTMVLRRVGGAAADDRG
jgi:hypothetical protein